MNRIYMLLGHKTRDKLKKHFNTLRTKSIKKDEEASDLVVPTPLTTNYRRSTEGDKDGLISLQLGKKENFALPSPYIFANTPPSGEGKLDQSFLKRGEPPEASRDKKINICVYNIQQKPTPYLTYLLYKYPRTVNGEEEEVIFPFINHIPNNSQSIIELTREKMKKVLSGWDKNIEYKGYLDNSAGVHLVFECRYENDLLLHQTRDDVWWWGLVDEMVNNKSLLNFPVAPTVTQVFLENPLLGILFDAKNTKIECPMVGFHGGYHKAIAFIAVLGLTRASITASMGPYYYFADYKRAGRYAMWATEFSKTQPDIVVDESNRFDRGGIVRFALFLGKSKFFLNRPDDPPDLSTKNVVNEYIKKTIKQRDVDGMWAQHHDSVFVSKSEITINGDVRTIAPQIILKNYTQQQPLSYHFVNTEQISDIGELENYFIE